MKSKSTIDKPSLNARVGAVSLVIGAIALLILTTQEDSLTPLRLLTLGIITLGVWALCDEMGMRYPLIRAGFVAFIFAMFARSSALVETHSDSLDRYYLLYAFALLIAIFIWSVAYLHRHRDLKIAGALGVVATIVPIIAIVFGHIVLGAGAFFGVSSLLTAAEGAAMNDFSAINTIDYIFSLWSFITAWFLWRGYIKSVY